MATIQRQLILTASFLMLTAIIIGAFGAHGLEGKIPSKQIASFQTGVTYQYYGAFSLFIFAFLFPFITFSMKWIYRFQVLGIVFFSGSIYLLATQSLLGTSLKFLWPITPLGGIFLILSWALLFVQFYRQRK